LSIFPRSLFGSAAYAAAAAGLSKTCLFFIIEGELSIDGTLSSVQGSNSGRVLFPKEKLHSLARNVKWFQGSMVSGEEWFQGKVFTHLIEPVKSHSGF
jgi:hypothetical protein